ncbi:MAG: hypothetical protein QOG84_125 [Sphingomonadales bacterium]|jgi:hypothetical protein|nr:hypothetical protein [Sphingomonadales bacterium]
MASSPPSFLVAAMHRILPPASREAVLGDLWEGYRTPAHFLSQGLTVLPFLILAQVRRRSSWPVLGLQAFVLFACLRGFVPLETHPPMWLRAALPTAFAFLALAWHDAYRAVQPVLAARRVWSEAASVLLAIAFYELVVAALGGIGVLRHDWLLRPVELLFAACSLPVLSVLRAGSGLLAAPSPAARVLTERSGRDAGDYAHFRRAVGRRNRLEIAAMAATLLLAGLIVARAPGAFPARVWLTLAGFLGLSLYLLLNGAAPALRDGGDSDAIRRAFRAEMLRQHRLRCRLVWWWFAPLFMGLSSRFILPGPAPTVSQAMAGLVLMIGLAACIDALNRERADLVRARLERLGAG